MRVNAPLARAILFQRGLTQGMLAEKAGVSRNTISNVFRGGACSKRTLENIAAALDVEIAVIQGIKPGESDRLKC